MTERLKWAILATGAVCNRFAKTLNNITDQAELLAVGSRSQASADAFTSTYNIPRAYPTYEEAANDPDVDIVYIGSPTTLHHRDARMCLEAGKHVLLEKAFTANAEEAQDLIDLAREKKLFLMEAMWTRFFPVQVKVRELLNAGAIGEAEGLIIHHNYMAPSDPPEAYDPKIGYGAFLDQAPYGVGYAYYVFGPPEEHTGIVTFNDAGITQQSCHVLRHPGDKISTLVATRNTVDVKEAIIYGSEGKIEVHAPWYKPVALTLHVKGKESELMEFPLDGYQGYEYEAFEVMNCIRAGKLESEIMSLDETLAIMQTMDSMRARWNV